MFLLLCFCSCASFYPSPSVSPHACFAFPLASLPSNRTEDLEGPAFFCRLWVCFLSTFHIWSIVFLLPGDVGLCPFGAFPHGTPEECGIPRQWISNLCFKPGEVPRCRGQLRWVFPKPSSRERFTAGRGTEGPACPTRDYHVGTGLCFLWFLRKACGFGRFGH